ncbi:uncharacterized protein EDB91DRAFT_1251244 [Suillus paluster]|uniref:uncharacterized protein n=1 Tax=Suillus paluster TaxID=48578 RepID=UPI001B87A89C|nr:uncharacterized protein EDB91DRAFT_1251244 [Suillus paluster]KAG1733579.1 hypothetical protein EDB91DRAFT_1251244 [Suillus paluster]
MLKDPSHRAERMLVFGPTLEDENLIVLLADWESVEAPLETVASPELQALTEHLFTLP